jgi:hypothetical protein
MCDDEEETNIQDVNTQIIIANIFEHFQHPERPDEFLIEYPPKQIIIIFQILKEYRGGFTSLQFKLYCNTIQTITCVGYSLKPEEHEDLLEVLSYFTNVKTVEFSENNAVLSNMLPFLRSLFEKHSTIKKFIFCRNIVLPANPQDSDIENLKECFKLMRNLKCLDLSAIVYGLFEESIDIVQLLIDIFGGSELESLILDSNDIEEEDFWKLYKGFTEAKINFSLSIKDSILIENPNDFYEEIFLKINETNMYSLEIINGDVESDADEPSDEVVKQIEQLSRYNFSLINCSTSSLRVNKAVEPYLERNLTMFWEPWNTYVFHNDFFKMLKTFLLMNENSSPKLPIIIFNKIFGFFNIRKFLDEYD